MALLLSALPWSHAGPLRWLDEGRLTARVSGRWWAQASLQGGDASPVDEQRPSSSSEVDAWRLPVGFWGWRWAQPPSCERTWCMVWRCMAAAVAGLAGLVDCCGAPS